MVTKRKIAYCLMGKWENDGALTEGFVEPIDPNALLENLEDWERYLQSDPDIAHKLRFLDQTASNTTKGPKLRGPRP